MSLSLNELGVQRIRGYMPSIMGYFNGKGFKFPCFLVFYARDTCWIKALQRPRPPIMKVTLIKIIPKLEETGWYLLDINGYRLRKLHKNSPEVHVILYGLDNKNNKVTPENLVNKWPVTQDWLCYFGGNYGRGTNPSIALINAEGEPSPEFIYTNLKKDKWL